MTLCYRKPGAAFATSARGGLSFKLVELLVSTAVIAIGKVWEQHDGQISLLFCDGHVEAVRSGDRFTKRIKMLSADGVYTST